MDDLAIMKRRGVDRDFCDALGIGAVIHWTKVKLGDEWIPLSPEVIHGQSEQGGLGIADAYGNVWILAEDIGEKEEIELILKLPGTDAT